jgi:hypothetical protein
VRLAGLRLMQRAVEGQEMWDGKLIGRLTKYCAAARMAIVSSEEWDVCSRDALLMLLGKESPPAM